jgi:hypothetical protein
VVWGVARAIGRASNVIREDPAQTRESLLKYFQATPPAVMDAVVKNLQTAFAPDGRQTESMWRNMLEFAAKAGHDVSGLDAREGGLWTNEFLDRR